MTPYGTKWLENKKKQKGRKKKVFLKKLRRGLERLRAYANNLDWSDWD